MTRKVKRYDDVQREALQQNTIRIHLVTVIFTVLVAGLMLGLNMHNYAKAQGNFEYGSPFTFYSYTVIQKGKIQTFDPFALLGNIAIVVMAGFACEYAWLYFHGE